MLLLCLSALHSGEVVADEMPTITLGNVFALLDPVIPEEWGGVWSSVDSTRECSGGLVSVETYLDTLCAGWPIFEEDLEFPITIECSGTATGTMVDVTCTGTGEFEGCTAIASFEINAIRNGESYTATNTTRIEFEGPGPECSFIPDFCRRTSSTGTRIAPEPAAYCNAAPVEPTTWGALRAIYR
jgi:hypothetical protein